MNVCIIITLKSNLMFFTIILLCRGNNTVVFVCIKVNDFVIDSYSQSNRLSVEHIFTGNLLLSAPAHLQAFWDVEDNACLGNTRLSKLGQY